MTPTRPRSSGAARNGPAMSSQQGAVYLRRIRLTTDQDGLAALRREILHAFPDDTITPSLVAMIQSRAQRLLSRN